MLWAIAAALSVSWLAARPAQASTPTPDGFWLPVGLELGASMFPDRPGGFFVGGEASLVSYEAGPWAGVFVDGSWDFGAEQLRHCIGPEIGFATVGIDGGYLGVLEDGTYRPGIAVRASGTLAFVAAYFRYGHVFAGAPAPDFAEVGFNFKFPIQLASRAPASWPLP